MQAAGGFTVSAPNRPPAITSTAVTSAAEGKPYAYQVVATDPDGDPVTYRLVTAPASMAIAGGLISWTPSAAQAGTHSVVVEAMDGRGGAVQQSFQISVTSIPQLQAIDLQPSLLRFSVVDTMRALSVAGLRTNGTTVDLTSTASGTVYESSNVFVARVGAEGTVTGVANGTATITARNSGLSDTTSVVVETGVTLEALELTPGSSTLRAAGATQALLLRGRFSDRIDPRPDGQRRRDIRVQQPGDRGRRRQRRRHRRDDRGDRRNGAIRHAHRRGWNHREHQQRQRLPPRRGVRRQQGPAARTGGRHPAQRRRRGPDPTHRCRVG